MRHLVYFLCIVCLVSCSNGGGKVVILPEWVKQEAVFLTYTEDPDDSLTSKAVRESCDTLLGQLSGHIKVFLLVNDNFNSDSLLTVFRSRGYNTKNIALVPVEHLFSMGVARDYGPIIVKAADGKRHLLQFDWNYVGANLVNPDTSWENWKNRTRDAYFRQMSRLLHMDIIKSDLMIEGGEIETNGNGTAMLVESFTLPRHPRLSRAAFDSLIKRELGLSKIIWLKEGVAEDPSGAQSYKIYGHIYGFGVGGHIDEFARFADPSTILLAFPDSMEAAADPVKRINYERMKVNYDILASQRDKDGNAFRIVRFPVPDILPDSMVIDTTRRQRLQVSLIRRRNPHLKHGDTIYFLPAVSYLNHVILNDLVIVPQYWKPGLPISGRQKDEQVRKLFEELYPSKKIVQLNPIGLNYGGGGFHCWTQQVPE